MPESVRERPDEHLGEVRLDIQGMRAFAVLLVALSHADVPHLAGGFVGVDVFFVISGFLITGLLLKKAATDGRFSFIEFYARRALRILPAAVLVLVVTDLAARYMLPLLQAKATVTDSIWAVFFLSNVHFADAGTDYFAQGQPPSPIQQFWSLSVEEQYYLAWPLILAIVLLGVHLVGRHGWRPETKDFQRAGVVLALLAGVSLFWSIQLTDSAPTDAYFSSLTRAWELAVGAIIALWSTALARIPVVVQILLGAIGLTAVGISSVVFTTSTPFPGYAALLPVLGTAALIVAGLREERGVNWALGAQPFRYVGDVSYSFYLWHWPVLILAAAWWGKELSVPVNLGLLGGAFLLAVATYHLFENPIRRGSLAPDAGGMTLAWTTGTCAVLVTAMFMSASITKEATSALVNEVAPVLSNSVPDEDDYRRLGPANFVVEAAEAARRRDAIPDPTTPDLDVADSDWPPLRVGACSGYDRDVDEIEPCQIGDPEGTQTVVIFGDSHAEMWTPALHEIGVLDRVKIYPFTKPGCGNPLDYLESKPECGEWYDWAIGRIRALHPDVVVMNHHANQGSAKWINGQVKVGQVFLRMGARVISMGDSPVLPEAAPGCLRTRGADLGTCAFPPPNDVGRVNYLGSTILAEDGIDFVPVSQWLCTDAVCPTVIGNVIVYVDTEHLTATYAAQLAAPLGAALDLRGS